MRDAPRTDSGVRLSRVVEAPGIVFVLEAGDHAIGMAHDDNCPPLLRAMALTAIPAHAVRATASDP